MTNKTVLIMAGGTGGHVFPALAIAKRLMQRGYKIHWLGTQGRLEQKLVPKHGIDISYVDFQGVRKNGLQRKLLVPFKAIRAIYQAIKVIKKHDICLAIGFGGYASAPGGVAAFLMRIPLVIHEQNAASGLSNRVLAKLATLILTGFKGAFVGKNVYYVGNPIRDDIKELYNRPKSFDDEILKILIVGGSLGAQAFNELLPPILLKCRGIHVTHQTGLNNQKKVEQLYQGAEFGYEVTEFIDDMSKAYQDAHLCICRAGALTVSEAMASKLPCIFIPLPTAVDDHQSKNAQTLVDQNASILLKQSEITQQRLLDIIQDLQNNREKLKAMSLKEQELAIIDSTDRVCDILIQKILENGK